MSTRGVFVESWRSPATVSESRSSARRQTPHTIPAWSSDECGTGPWVLPGREISFENLNQFKLCDGNSPNMLCSKVSANDVFTEKF